MIIYYDNGNRPLFREHFTASGVIWSRQHRNLPAQGIDMLLRHASGAPVPSSLLFRPLPENAGNTVIVFDYMTTSRYLNWLRKTYPDKRIILWMWNKVTDPSRFRDTDPEVEIWSYDPQDCRTYGYRHNTQFFFDDLAAEAAGDSVQGDGSVLFVGRDKSRSQQIDALSEELKASGHELKTHIVPQLPFGFDNVLRTPFIPYSENIRLVRNSGAVLDLPAYSSCGLSLRVMEALFFSKKLITANRAVMDMDFYDPDNILILGEGRISLDEFLSRPFRPVDRQIRDRYLLSSWIGRFSEVER